MKSPIAGLNNVLDDTEVSVQYIEHYGIELRVGSPYGQGRSRVCVMDAEAALTLAVRLILAVKLRQRAYTPSVATDPETQKG